MTQGATEEEALQHINEVVQMIVDELIEDGVPVPANPQEVDILDGMRVTVPNHSPGSTFVPKTLRSMIEEQARWNEADLRRLKPIK